MKEDDTINCARKNEPDNDAAYCILSFVRVSLKTQNFPKNAWVHNHWPDILQFFLSQYPLLK